MYQFLQMGHLYPSLLPRLHTHHRFPGKRCVLPCQPSSSSRCIRQHMGAQPAATERGEGLGAKGLAVRASVAPRVAPLLPWLSQQLISSRGGQEQGLVPSLCSDVGFHVSTHSSWEVKFSENWRQGNKASFKTANNNWRNWSICYCWNN